MLCVTTFLVIVVVVLLVYQTQWVGSLNRAFSAIVERYGGTLRKGTFPCRPSASFTYNDMDVLVELFARGMGPAKYTRMHAHWPDQSFRCTVMPEPPAIQKRFMGMHDIIVGNPHFDRRYLITGNDEAQVREMITPAVQERIDDLYRLLANNQVYVSFSYGRLQIVKLGVFHRSPQMLAFVNLCLQLVDAALENDQQGIEFLSSTADGGDELPVCQICGEKIREGIVYCKSCKTPHHDDCWSYYGACSTYGCGQTRSSP